MAMPQIGPTDDEAPLPRWTFLTNHAHVLIAVKRNGDLRQRDISGWWASRRAPCSASSTTSSPTATSVASGSVGATTTRSCSGTALRHPLEDSHTVDDLLAAVED